MFLLVIVVSVLQVYFIKGSRIVVKGKIVSRGVCIYTHIHMCVSISTHPPTDNFFFN